MAKVIDIEGVENINIGATVGVKGMNLREDVMVIQALMNYALKGRPILKSDYFPAPTGIMSSKTERMIKEFQMYLKRKGMRIHADGRIDPTKSLFYGKSKMTWTLGHLNSEALSMCNSRSVGDNWDYIKGLCDMYPRVRDILKQQRVGSLNLSLA